MTISFLQLRPADVVNELWATTRRKEGTTTVEVPALTAEARAGSLAGGLLPVATSIAPVAPAAWVVAPEDAVALAAAGEPGWRITVVDDPRRDVVVDAVARSAAAYLRTRRSTVDAAASIASLPGVRVVVSVFVDSVDEAMAAVAAGAGDLLLRGWTTDMVAQLRDALQGDIVERVAIPPGTSVGEARERLDGDLFAVYLDQIDATGHARPRGGWAPGKDLPAPVPEARLSAAWPDAAWRSRTSPLPAEVRPRVRAILQRSAEGIPPDRDDVQTLFEARGAEVDAIAEVADELRRATVGDTVTYVVNRNINYTNQCYFRCGFCAFSKGPRSLNLRGEPYLLSIAQVVERTVDAHRRGATEVCLQGGIHPEFTGDFYVHVLEAIKEAVPEMHVHGFTPLEVWQGAETSGTSVAVFLERLRDAGLGTLPGTAAEILDDRIRRHLCPDKIRTAQWAEVMITAHELGLRSTATMMFGHIDDPGSWAEHFEVLRAIQRRTGGITEFVPLPFVHMGAPIYLRGRARPGPTWDEVVLVHAVARIAFAGLIDNIQASWVKLGLDGGIRLLDAGCNDLGGTLMDETISRAAGAAHGTTMDASDFESAIVAAGRRPMQRTTLYAPVHRGAPLHLRAPGRRGTP